MYMYVAMVCDYVQDSQESGQSGRYSMRRRHTSGGSGIVEQLTQSYGARMEGSPKVTTRIRSLRPSAGQGVFVSALRRLLIYLPVAL